MEVIGFYESERQEHWLNEIKKCDWAAGAFLYELLARHTFFDTVGEGSRLLLLTDGDKLVSFCTCARKDDIPDTELSPWIGFVYTFPEYRGHRYVGKLLREAERITREEGDGAVYISTTHVGLYEKYGYRYMTEMRDIEGYPSRIYIKMLV